jgi:hypothetical protein
MKLLTSKPDAMRRILHLVSHGYTNYVQGEVSINKIKELHSKFSGIYDINANYIKRHRNRKKGLCNSELVVLKVNEKVCKWWLLSTAGDGNIYKLERLLDAKNKNSRILSPDENFELIKTPRIDLKASWTWRMTSDTVASWEARIKISIRNKNDKSLEQCLYFLRRVPGFRECRKQAFGLVKLAKSEWKRSRSDEFPYPDVFIGFFGRFKVSNEIEF